MEVDRLRKPDRKFAISLAAGIALWGAFPPLKGWPLSLVAIACYLSLIQPSTGLRRKDYIAIWIGASLAWLGLLQGVRLAYWPLHAGWIALALYLALYSVGFVALSRVLVHRWRWPLAVAAPLAWCTFELIRGYVITGFSACLLGHVLVDYPLLFQTAAHFGPYAVSGGLVLSSVLLWDIGRIAFRYGWSVPWLKRMEGETIRLRSVACEILISGFVLLSMIGYGAWEVARGNDLDRQRQPLLTAALIQENSPTIFDHNLARVRERSIQSWFRYVEQTRAAAAATSELDLVVWPESMFTRIEQIIDWNRSRTLPDRLIAEGLAVSDLEETVAYLEQAFDRKVAEVHAAIGENSQLAQPPLLLVGHDVARIRDQSYDQYNGALWIGSDGKLIDYYAKRHLVMFGEYIPLVHSLPFISQLGWLPRVSPGEKMVSFRIEDRVRISPSICFENVLPHLIQQQIRQLERQQESPQVMINITNDGWFRGSSITDHHLANATFASVENRRPMLVAANTGLSAWIDGNGRRIQVSERLKPAHIIARPIEDGRWGLWQDVGDWPMRGVAAVSLFLGMLPRKAPRFPNRKGAVKKNSE